MYCFKCKKEGMCRVVKQNGKHVSDVANVTKKNVTTRRRRSSAKPKGEDTARIEEVKNEDVQEREEDEENKPPISDNIPAAKKESEFSNNDSSSNGNSNNGTLTNSDYEVDSGGNSGIDGQYDSFYPSNDSNVNNTADSVNVADVASVA
eukprot:Pgem_evm1s9160